MSTDTNSDTPMNHLPEAARDVARRTEDAARETAQRAAATARDVTRDVEKAAGEVTNATKDAAKHATDTVKDMYHSAAEKAGDTLTTSKEYVRRNPVPVVLGAIAFGAAIGYLIMSTRRRPTFSEQYVEEPLVAVREALLSALAPVSQRVHDGYESARHGVGKAMNRAHRTRSGRAVDMLSDRIGRVGSNLKFW